MDLDSRPIFTVFDSYALRSEFQRVLGFLLLWRDKRWMATNWGWLTVQTFSPLSSWWEAWWHVGRHGAGEEAETLTSVFSCSRRRLWATRPAVSFWTTLHPHPHDTCPPITTPTPRRPRLLIVTYKPIGGHLYLNHRSVCVDWKRHMLYYLQNGKVLAP